MLNIPIILGTARQGRRSENVANFMLSQFVRFGSLYGFKTELIDVRNFLTNTTDGTETSAPAKKLNEKISVADGLVIISPEYNHSFPGELKLMIDMLHKQYAKKPIGFCGVSAGPWGGNKAVEQLRLVSIELHMVPIREALYFPFVQNLFDEKGDFKDPDSYQERIKTLLDELIWYAKNLKIAREQKN
jgi:NAD(P)H-dependent FMN reductase